MKIEHISVSRKQCVEECEQKYKYRYHMELERPGPEPFYFTYGKMVHTIAEEFVGAKGKKTIQEVADSVLNGEIPIDRKDNRKALKLPPDYQKKLPGHLRAVQKITDQVGMEGHLEYSFNYDLDPPNNRCVVGFIDRLVPMGDKYFILDYKTTKKGRWRKNIQTVVDDPQLRCYARVVQKKFDVPADKIRAALYYLEGGDLVGAKFSQKSLDNIEKELLDVYLKIENKDPETVMGRVGFWCNNCDYKSICPFYRSNKIRSVDPYTILGKK